MFKKDYRSPQRASARPSMTRDGAKLGRRHIAFYRPLYVMPVECSPAGAESKKYRLQLETDNDNIVDLSALAGKFEDAGCLIKMSTIEQALDSILEVVPRYIAETGRGVRIGNIALLKPYVAGSIDHINAAPDPVKNRLEIHASECPAIRHAITNAQIVNRLRKKDGIDFVYPDKPYGQQQTNIIDAAFPFIVYGSKLYVPVQTADNPSKRGSIRVETRDGELVGYCDVISDGPILTTARLAVAKRPANRLARLVVETYGTRQAAEEGGDMAIYTRNISLVM